MGWPKKFDVFGLRISCTTYDELVAKVISEVKAGSSFVVDFISVDPLVQTTRSQDLRDKINSFEIVCPDGHPVRVAMNILHGTQMTDRVCGPDSTLRVLEAAGDHQISVFFYGSTDQVLTAIREQIALHFPKVVVAGTYSPPYRPLSSVEKAKVVEMINLSGAGITMIGLGAPRQSLFAYEFRNHIKGALMCTGAAFDFLAKSKRRAPIWMQKSGIEWVYRFGQEPRRLFTRYTTTNLIYFRLLLFAWLKKQR